METDELIAVEAVETLASAQVKEKQIFRRNKKRNCHLFTSLSKVPPCKPAYEFSSWFVEGQR